MIKTTAKTTYSCQANKLCSSDKEEKDQEMSELDIFSLHKNTTLSTAAVN